MKVGVVGAGFVGATSAYALVMRGVGREVVLVDKNRDRARAEADDILHAVPFASPMKVSAGDYKQLGGCRVVVVSAGVGQKPGESRLELLQRNASVFEAIIPQIVTNAPHAVLLVVSNPVDVMTHLAACYAEKLGVPSSRVIGSGTALDTARFRALLGNLLGVDPYHVHAHVVGEHGDSEVLAWSLVKIGGIPLEDFCRMQEEQSGSGHTLHKGGEARQEVDQRVRRAAYRIIEGKGATYFGIGSAVAHIVNVVLRDQRAILTLSTPTSEILGVRNVSISLPRLIGGQGVLGTFPQPLDKEESEALGVSARIIGDALAGLGLSP